MHPFDPVLAVVDPTSTAQPAAHKAARLAAATGSGLHLLVCDYEAAFDDDPLYRSDVAEAAALCADLHLVHACSDSALLAAATSGARPLQEGIDTAELIRIERRRLEHGLAALADAHGVHATRITVQEGSPPAVILALAHQLSADIVVMGALSRSELRKRLLGSTAERTLDRLACDLLVVKVPT